MLNILPKNSYDIARFLLLTSVILLSLIGIIALYSVSSLEGFVNAGDSFFYVKNQILYGFLIGTAFFLIIYKFIDINLIRKYSFHILLFLGVLMFLSLMPGVGVSYGGASRWINLGLFQFQPSEFLKPAFILYISAIFSKFSFIKDFKKYGQVYGKSVYLPFLIISGIIALLFYLQKDASTFILILLSAFFVFLLSRIPSVKYIIILLMIGILLFGFFMLTESYRIERIPFFSDAQQDTLGIGYQKQQSLIAVGSGGIWGKGIGSGFDKEKIPAKISDSIFASFAEEIGFIGSFAIIMLFIAFFWLGFYIASLQKEEFNRLLIYGIIILLSIQAIINIATSLGIFITGVPLPFISYGKSSLISSIIMISILMKASKR